MLNNTGVNVRVLQGGEIRRILPPLPLDYVLRISGLNGEIELSKDDLEKHILFLGCIGSGKTNAIFQVVSELKRGMTDNDVMVIFDTKGDYLKQFYNPTVDCIISNREEQEGNIPCNFSHWNLFEDIKFEHEKWRAETVNEICRTLYDPFLEKAKDSFFPNAARDLTSSVLNALCKKTPNASNLDIRHYLYDESIKELRVLLGEFQELKGALQYIELDGPQTQGILSTIKIMIQDLFSGSFKNPGKFSMRNFIHQKSGRCVFIEYDIAAGKVLLPIYRLLFDLAIKESLSRKRSEGNVYFVVDEFGLLPNLYYIDDGVNFGRALGAKFIVGAQNVGQIIESYGEGRGYSILSGFANVFAFRLFDKISRDFVSDRYGANYKQLVTRSTQAENNLTEQLTIGKVIEDWNISMLETGHCIVSSPGKLPFFFNFRRTISS